MQKRILEGRGLAGFTLAVLFFLSAGIAVSLAQPLEGMRADEIIKEADLLLKANRTDDAVPYLNAYLQRTADAQDIRVMAAAQDVRVKLASIMAQRQSSSEASAMLEDYLARSPRPQWHDVMKLLAVSQLESGEMEKCLQTATAALAGPPPEVKAEIAELAAMTAPPPAEEDEDEADTKPKYEFDKYGELITKKADAPAVEAAHPSGYSQDDLLVLNMTMGEALLGLGRGKESMVPFSYVVEHTADEVRKGYAIMQVVNALIEMKDFKTLTGWIPQLYRTNARYDIRVNLALMNAATALFDAGEYDSALPLFRMILPRNELIAYQSGRVKELQIKAGIIPPEPSKEAGKAKVEETLMGKRYRVTAEEFWTEKGSGPAPNKPKELVELEELIRTLEALPPYETEVLYRNALLYDEVERPWEAARFFDRVYQADSSSDMGLGSFHNMIRLLLDPLNEIQEAERRGMAYLNATKEGLTPRQVAYQLSGWYQQHERAPSVKKLLPCLQGFVPSKDPLITKYECELYFMQAVADLMLLNYEQAEAGFTKVLTDFPKSSQEDNATYWHAVSVMFQQKYEAALAEFEAYGNKFPTGEWVPASVFQSGTCLFGMERYDEAMERFTQVIEKYPKAASFSDACSLRGDIYGSKGLLDEAISDYRKAIAGARTPAQAKYAVFQMAAVFEAEKRYEEIFPLVNSYMARYGDEADISEGIYWIGKTRMNQGLLNEAVKSYYDAIIKYGPDLGQEGVDSIIAELVRTAKVKLKEDGRSQLKAQLLGAVSKTDSLTLRLRIRAALAQMDNTEIALGKQLISELPDLENAAPPVLSAICQASFELKDYSRAEELLNVFLTKFSESEFMRPAFKLRAFDLYRSGKLDEALKLIAEAQSRYGTDYDVAWAQLMKGDILMQQARYAGAAEAFTAVLNVSGWRGESYAEAAYKLGAAEEAAGDPRKAFGWYQRAYFQYKGYAKGYWAAEAYLASARCLEKMGRTNDARNTYRAMLFDRFVKDLPQAAEAVKVLGAAEALEIKGMLESGVKTNLTVNLDAEEVK